ncbi:MAG: site-2 protease family protein [Oscillospiraceae bacterium]|nr:site-2 protease family protein [Oscillospiraceae bacterium]
MFIILAILAFGLLIAIHELGHFFSAKLLGVRVIEFAIGMGPKLIGFQGKETLYTLRLLPLGGFCTMDGQDESMEDPRAFTSQRRWRRIVILLAGSAANIIAAFIIIAILTAGSAGFIGTTLTGIADGFPNEGEDGLMVGDTIVSINGERLFYAQDFSTFMQFAGGREVNLVILRDGERLTLNNFPLERREFVIDGEVEYRFGLTFNFIEATAGQQLRHSVYTTFNFARLIRVTLAQLFAGEVGLPDIAGPVGIVDAMSGIAQESPTMGAAIGNIAFFTAFIGVNLAVMNLLPIPALDGGRILFIIISWLIEKVIRRQLDPKYEGYIHSGAMVLLFGLMILVLVNDVVRLIGR